MFFLCFFSENGGRMASRIKGIIIEIGGDTTKLEQSLKAANSTIKTTQQSQLKDVSCLLELEPTITELLSQKAGGSESANVKHFLHLWIKTNSNQYVWSIEHIFSQGPNIPN